MAHHLSAKKRIRQTESRKVYNRYYAKTARNAVRKFRSLSDKTEAQEKLPGLISSMINLLKEELFTRIKLPI
jgi:small subunit ribosomal protein S20